MASFLLAIAVITLFVGIIIILDDIWEQAGYIITIIGASLLSWLVISFLTMTFSLETAEVHIINNTALVVDQNGEIHNLNKVLDINFKDGDQVDIVHWNRWSCGVYYAVDISFMTDIEYASNNN